MIKPERFIWRVGFTLLLLFIHVKAKQAEKPLLPGLPDWVVLAKPQKGGISKDICHGLWKAKGTYCDLQSLLEYDKTQTGRLKMHEGEFAKTIEDLTYIARTFKDSPKLSSGSKDRLVDFLDQVNKGIFLGNSTKCSNFMNRARSSSLCSRCSTDYKSFLVKKAGEYKFIVSEEFCTDMLKECHLHLKQIAALAHWIYPSKVSKTCPLNEILGILQDKPFKTEYIDKPQSIQDLELLDSWRDCEDPKKKQEIANEVCGHTMRIGSRPLVVKLVLFTARRIRYIMEQILEQAEDRMPLLKHGIDYHSNWDDEKEADEDEDIDMINFFEGDVEIIGSQHNEKSTNFCGTDGLSNSKIKSMNMSLQFP